MARFSLRPILCRLSSRHSAAAESTNSDDSHTTAATSASPAPSPQPVAPRQTPSLAKLREKFRNQDADIPELPQQEQLSERRASSVSAAEGTQTQVQTQTPQQAAALGEPTKAASIGRAAQVERDVSELAPRRRSPGSLAGSDDFHDPQQHQTLPHDLQVHVDDLPVNPRLVLEEATPGALADGHRDLRSIEFDLHQHLASPSTTDRNNFSRHNLANGYQDLSPRQSIIDSADANVVNSLVDAPQPTRPSSSALSSALPTGAQLDFFSPSVPNMATMLQRKIWVKRPNASATLVVIREDDLVDDVREMILRKYANSLGKTFDAPDLTLTIVTRSEHAGPRTSRMLSPEEGMCRTIDSYYPSGQTVDEALIIDLPQKRTPRPSPRHFAHSYHAMEDLRPLENGNDYFPPMPVTIQPALPAHPRDHHSISSEHPRSISVLNTGQIPPLPSPGGTTRRHRAEREHRPKYGRQHTSSPTIISNAAMAGPMTAVPALPASHLAHRSSTRPRMDSSASEAHHAPGPPAAPPLPTPPAPEAPPTGKPNSNPPTPSGGAIPSALGHRGSRPRNTRKPRPDRTNKNRSPLRVDTYNPNGTLPGISSVLDGSVPPINVLIVEDNIINLRILEGLMKRLKVRWQTAMNGQIAVDKWKGGGYHLVLMDIQMPVMNGLQATKEIRRLERVNGIGVFSSTPGSPIGDGVDANGDGKIHNAEDDKVVKSEGMFKSPIIIVALTASSLQSDRHEALAAGCNDFLTKPVNFVWLERKVKEWGCMQALIDFDGWRKWKDYTAKEEAGKSEEQKQKEREDDQKQKMKMEKMAKLQEKQRQRAEEQAKEKERKKRESLGSGDKSPNLMAEDAPVIEAPS